MIKVNWREIERLNSDLCRQGWKKDNIFLIDILYNQAGEPKPAKTSIKTALKSLRLNLYNVESQRAVVAVVVKDPKGHPIWQAQERPQVGEEVPTNGHDHVVEKFNSLEKIQRRVWTKITEAALVDYMANEHSND